MEKMMKRVAVLFLIVIVSIGCATKEEKARTNLTQVWRIAKVFQNGQNITMSYLENHVNYRISFSNNGTFLETYLPADGSSEISINGAWVFSDGINKITLTDNNQSRIFEIDLLDEDNFNVTDLGSSNGRQFEFLPD
jgi:outer membrane lipoprotein-sorting protein